MASYLTFANNMKTLLITTLSTCLTIVTACNKKAPATTMVETKVAYSHPLAIDGKIEMSRRQEIGTIRSKMPSSGQPLSLTNKSVVWFSQSTDASDPSKIRVTVESKLDGFPPETQKLEFDSAKPYHPTEKFKNGLSAAVTVNTYTK